MTDESPEKPPKISKKDADLWRAVTGDVQRLKGKKYTEGRKDADPPPIIRETIAIKLKTAPPSARPKGREVDARTQDRFRKGRMEIEAALDLHGYSQQQAYEALRRFIMTAHEAGKRCVLVVTGKGRGEGTGVLKQKTPLWLEEADIAPLILQTHQAKHHDGGAGALYILLRRKR